MPHIGSIGLVVSLLGCRSTESKDPETNDGLLKKRTLMVMDLPTM